VLGLALVVVLGAGGLVAYDRGLLDDYLRSERSTPAELPPPAGVTVPEVSRPDAVLSSASASTSTPRGMRRSLADELDQDDFGPRLGVLVEDLVSGTELLRTSRAVFTPASTLKILTATAVLDRLGPRHRFSTSVTTGARAGEIVLVGGGDPMLARRTDRSAYPRPASIEQLAERTARRLAAQGTRRVRLGYDDSLFSGPAVNPAWEPSYVPSDVVTPVSALWVDEGLGPDRSAPRSTEPSAAAAQAFAEMLEAEGISVRGRVAARSSPTDAETISAVRSPPLAQLVAHVLLVSDNEGAEVLLRHVALASGRPGSSAAGARAVVDTLSELGVNMSRARVLDGSGLARGNRLSLDVLVDTLRVAAQPERQRLRPVLTGLPVAGFSGSLTYRFAADYRPQTAPGIGKVRAKTGTLSGVHGVAGVILDRSGGALLYVAIADRVRLQDTLDARAELDDLSAALAECGCA